MSQQLDAIGAALQKAHDAGNVDDAKQLADAYRAQMAQESQPASDPHANTKITDPAVAQHLTNLYQQASNVMGPDSPQAKQIFQLMQQHGMHLGAPTGDTLLASDAKAAQNTVGENSFAQNHGMALAKDFWVSPYHGLQQMGASIADSVNPLPQTTTGLVSGQQPTRRAQLDAQLAPADAANNALDHTWGGLTGGLVAGGAQLAVPVGDIAGLAGLTGKAALYANAALKGGAYMGAQEVRPGGSRTLNALTGAAIPLALPSAVGGAKLLGNMGGRLVGSDAAADRAVSKLLGNNGTLLGPLQSAGANGYTPTSAEATLGLGGGKASAARIQAEQAMRTTPQGAVLGSAHDAANNAAHVQTLADVAGTDIHGQDPKGLLQAAQQAREAATQPFIDANLKPQMISDRFSAALTHVNDFLKNNPRANPATIAAMKNARTTIKSVLSGSAQEDDAVAALHDIGAALPEAPNGVASKAMKALDSVHGAINQGMSPTQPIKDLLHKTLNSGIASNKSVAQAIRGMLDRIKTTENTRGMVSSDVLDGMRQSLDTYLPPDANGQAFVGIGPIKHAITATLNKAHPADPAIPGSGYSGYLADYAKLSQPINTMQAGRDALAAIGTRATNSSGGDNLSLNAINQIIKKAKAGDYPIAPDAMAKLEAISNQLQNRSAINNTIGGLGGSRSISALLNTLPTAAQVALKVGGTALAGHLTGIPGAEAAGPLLYGLASLGQNRLQGKVAERMLSSPLAALALKNAAPKGPDGLSRLYSLLQSLPPPK